MKKISPPTEEKDETSTDSPTNVLTVRNLADPLNQIEVCLKALQNNGPRNVLLSVTDSRVGLLQTVVRIN